jgi:alpha-L-rhamnosidase
MKIFFTALLFIVMVDVQATAATPPTVDPTYAMGAKAQAASPTVPAHPNALVSKWIWSSKTANETIFARKTFSLSKVPQSAVLSATADDSFEIYVNGHQVGGTPLPVQDMAWANVQQFHVEKFLTAGPNIIAVKAVNQGGAAGLMARLDMDDKEVLTTDEHWLISDQADLSPQWNQVGFDDSHWTPAIIVAPYGEGPWGNALVNWPGAQNDAPYMAHLIIPAKSVQVISGAEQITGNEMFNTGSETQIKITPGKSTDSSQPVLLVDFGQELAGRLQVWGTDGTTVSVTIGESKEECDHVEPKLDNNGPFELHLAGSEPASTSYTAFRYAKLTFQGQTPVEIKRIACDHKYYPVRYRGSFDCSDPLLTRIWYTGAYTAHLCMQEQIWDAPKRDRGLWIGDLQVTGQTINTVFADKFLMELSISEVRDEAQHGRPPTELPTTDVNTLPGYSAAWFCTLADFYRHSGDHEFLAQQHEKMISLLEYQQTEFDKQSVYINGTKWDFCDWAPGFVTDSPLARAATHLYIVYGLHEAVFLLRELGDTANADKYSAWADQLTAAARTQFIDPNTRTFGNRIQENVMAILSGVATPEEQTAIYAQVLQPDNPGWKAHMAGNVDESEVISPYYGYFVINALEKLGRHQDAVDLIRRYWGDMLRRGATTWWEKFDPAWPEDLKATLDKMPYLSLSHGWSTGPTSYLTQTVLGVRPTSAGYRTVEIHPQLGDLTWAEGDVPTPGGLIHVRIEHQANQLKTTIKLPTDISAAVLLGQKSFKADHAGTFRFTASNSP